MTESVPATTSGDREPPALSEREYPVLAAIWDNKADAAYDRHIFRGPRREGARRARR